VRAIGRRALLRLASAAPVALLSRPSLAAGRSRRPPKTLDDLLDEVERLLSPEALALIYATPEPELLDFASGVFSALSMRLDARAWAARNDIFEARGVPYWDDQKVFFVTALVRRHRGQPLDIEEQLAAKRAASARLMADLEKRNRELGTPGTKYRFDQMGFSDIVYFERGSTRPVPGQERLAALPALFAGFPDISLVEVEGHAEPGERDGRALSEARARWVIELLVRGGVAAAKLLPHGLGASYPETDPDRAKVSGRDRRVDFVILKRKYLPPTTK
jgi:outer membrane protein OmpA-like peptidoglycan-associated protein